jgi:IQ calmodulin-binding motif
VLLWRSYGPGSQLMARRIQRLVRGFLARRRVGREVQVRLDAKARRIQSLYHIFKANQNVRVLHAAIYNEAAAQIQKIWRGEALTKHALRLSVFHTRTPYLALPRAGLICRRLYYVILNAMRHNKANKIQKTWRMYVGKVSAKASRRERGEHVRASARTHPYIHMRAARQRSEHALNVSCVFLGRLWLLRAGRPVLTPVYVCLTRTPACAACTNPGGQGR